MHAATPDNPFVSLWSEFAQASWVAAVGLPLAATISAIVISYLLVRKQLEQGRNLARAQRRAEAARRLGQALIREARRPDLEDTDASFWSAPEWPDFSGVLDAVRETEIVVGEDPAFEDAVSVTRTSLWVWRACLPLRRVLTTEGLDSSAVTGGQEAAIHDWQNKMRTYGKEIVRWDGFGNLPRLDIGNLKHVPLPDRRSTEHVEWMDGYRRTSETTARRIAAREAARGH